jgi:phospholipid transport system substrate-binding protein
MSNRLTRRRLGGVLLAGAAVQMLPRTAFALDDAEASALIDRAIADVHAVINSGKPEAEMIADFEQIFITYADSRTIGQSALGVAARSATPAQMEAFTLAFRGYISRKYGRRFREFIGGKIEVTGSRKLKSFYEVRSIAHLRGEAPFELLWHVSDASGKDLFFNLIIEGVNMLASERTEVGAMLDRRRGDIDALIADLKAAG